MDASPTSPAAAPALVSGRSLDQQVDASPNHSNYSNLTNNSGSSPSGSSVCSPSTTSSSSSAPQYSEDLRAAAAAVRHNQTPNPTQNQNQSQSHSGSAGTGSSSTGKTCEVDVGEEERDTFSPVSSPDCNGAASALGAEVIASVSEPGLDNKIFEGGNGSGSSKSKPASKEEKQRQNEEIVCMETSTVSTETGSWESMYPVAVEPPPPAPSALDEDGTMGTEAESSSVFKGISASCLLRDLEKRDQPLSTSGTSACFIDASSLRDEDEVLSFPSLDGHAQEEEHEHEEEHEAEVAAGADDQEQETQEASPTQQLEQFHKAFARCKGSSTSHGRSSSNDADSSDSSLSVKMRREQEEQERPMASLGGGGGPYSFQHNAQHFSVHPLGSSPKFATHHHSHSHQNHNNGQPDLSYTTDYSSSSPAPSLVWSEHSRATHAPHSSASASVSASTPHNSMVHIEPASGSNNSSIHRDYTLSSSLSHHRDSGAYCSDATDSPLPLPRTPKRCSKFDEANPIVSGGASIEDFRQKQCESPSIKRRTDTCPIVSGGFVSLDFAPTRPLQDDDEDDDDADDAEISGVELRVKSGAGAGLQRKPVTGIASWVVDMSDCRPERRRSTSSTTSSFRERSDSNSSHKSGCGFYVSLDDMDRKPAPEPQPQAKPQAQPPSQLSKSYTGPKSAGFFVNLAQNEPEQEVQPKAAEEKQQQSEQKNIFSMFIDIGGEQKTPRGPPNGRKEPLSLAQRLSSSLSSSSAAVQRRGEVLGDVMKSSASSTETLMAKSATQKEMLAAGAGESKSLDYRCNLDPPLTVAALRRISQQQRQQQQSDSAKRHSWGSNGNPEHGGAGNDCKRSISLTANGVNGTDSGAGLMSIIDKLPIISKASSLSVDSSLSPYDDYSGGSNAGGLSSCSDEEQQQQLVGGRLKKRRCDAQLNETYDKSSMASVTEGVLSKDMSPASNTDTDDLTFQQDEQLAQQQAQEQQQQQQLIPVQLSSSSNRTSVMETIIEAKETASPKKTVTVSSSLTNGHTMESLHATIEKQKQLLETVNEHGEQQQKQAAPAASSFVKLSDMDKPVKHDLQSPDSMSKSVGNNHRNSHSSQLGQRLYRDENKGRPHSWAMTRSTCNSLQNFTNSVDNIRSLSRLFPNFSKEFSNSLPNDMTLEHAQAQQQQVDYIQTDLSADSSLASSFSRSGMDESSISCRQPRRLGEDLLKMFLQEIATDMLVEVHGRRIRAHKCILRSRCQYFAAMLAGHGSQSVVSLQGYSYAAVHFALCHIYSGASHPPDGISLMELAALADLLGLEGLKEVTSHALKTNYCHNFHKPCSGCIDGILQVLPVALNHALDDLYRKCLRWTCRHYLKVWPTRQFAQLPPDILGRCRQQIIAYMTSETVLDTVLDCEHLLAQLSAYRWGHVCEQLVRDILDAAHAYVGDHFASLIASDAFLSLGHDRSRHIPHLEALLRQAASELTPEQACRSYQRVTRLNAVLRAKLHNVPGNLSELVQELHGLQEEEQLDWKPDYVRLVCALVYTIEQCLIRQCSRAMRVTAWQRMDLELRKKIQGMARLTEPLDMKRQGGKAVGKAFSFGGSTRSQDLVQIKLAIQAQSKRAHAQETHMYKATQTQDAAAASNHVQTADRGVQANHDSREVGSSKLLKSNSRAHVPHRAASQVASERNSINLHRRTQSEAPPVTHHKKTAATAAAAAPLAAETKAKPTAAPRLGEIRPRYLEPRKPRATLGPSGPVRSATSSGIPASGGARKAPAKNLHISSSDSSRNSSPAATRRVQNGNAGRLGNKSSNLSMDSLSSPARRAKSSSRGPPNDRYSSDQNVDSMAESMKSSVITNKTISHESLSGSSKLARIQQLNGHTAGTKQLAAAGGKTKPLQRGSTVGNKSTRQLKQQHNAVASNGSSPSSVHTTKSATSRLSSVSSTLSTRELFKQRSISVPAGGTEAAPANKGRHSFLSAKSREILAKRAEKNKLQQQQQQQQQKQSASAVESLGDERGSHNLRSSAGPLRSSSHSAVASMLQQHNLRNSLPSNIPTRRPNTLQLKKTTAVSNGVATKVTTNGINGSYKAAQAVKQKLDLLIDAQMEGAHMPMERVESKLERSSTFCKDSADLDISELQIVE